MPIGDCLNCGAAPHNMQPKYPEPLSSADCCANCEHLASSKTETTSVRISKSHMARLRAAIIQKHGTLYGNLAEEVEKAIEARIKVIRGGA